MQFVCILFIDKLASAYNSLNALTFFNESHAHYAYMLYICEYLQIEIAAHTHKIPYTSIIPYDNFNEI